MKKNISRNPLWPDWYNGKKIDEVQFGRAFLEQWPLKCVNGTLYTLDGPVEDESEIKQRILDTFLLAHLTEYHAYILFDLAVNHHPPIFRCKHHMILTSPCRIA